MKGYLIIEVDSYNYEYITDKCFLSKEKAEKYCAEKNKDTIRYLEKCADEYEPTGFYSSFEVREIEVIEYE